MGISKAAVRLFGSLLVATITVATTISGVTSASPAGAATSLAPIKIGTTIWDLPSIVLDIRLQGAKAAVRAINKAGGINGHKLQWIYCPESDADSAEACARTMVSDGVVATFGDAALNDEVPFGQILVQAGIPQIDPFVTAPQSFANPNVYLPSGGNNVAFASDLAAAKVEKLKTWHFIEGISPSAAQILATIDQTAKYYGLSQIGSPTEVPITAADASPYVADAATANAQIVVAPLGPFITDLFLTSMEQLGKKFRLGTDNEYNVNDLKKYGEPGGPLDGALIADMLPPLSAANQFPAIKEYEKQITAEYRAGDSLAAPGVLNPSNLESWLMVQVFADLARSLHTVKASTVKHALNTDKNLSMLGLLPPWTPSKKGPPGYARVSQPYMYLMIVRNGQTQLLEKKPINALVPLANS